MFGFNKPATTTVETQPEQLPDLAEDQMPAEQVEVDVAVDEGVISVEPKQVSVAAGTGSRFFKQAPTQILKPSIISEGFQLVGDITSSGGLHVEGTINGKIQVDNVTIGAKGVVKGQIKCNALSIKGHFDGEAVCDTLSLSGNAVVNGDVQYVTLTMASGTILTGQLKQK